MENTNQTRILQAAHDLFNTRGYRNVTVQDLAEQLGMSKKTIYQYFNGKEEIAVAVVEDTMKKLDQAVNLPELAEKDPFTVIKHILTNIKEESMRFGPLFLMDIEKYLPELAQTYRQYRNNKKQGVAELLAKAQAQGLLKEVPIPMVMEILSNCVKALVRPENTLQSDYSTQAKVELFLDIFCSGIAKQH